MYKVGFVYKLTVQITGPYALRLFPISRAHLIPLWKGKVIIGPHPIKMQMVSQEMMKVTGRAAIIKNSSVPKHIGTDGWSPSKVYRFKATEVFAGSPRGKFLNTISGSYFILNIHHRNCPSVLNHQKLMPSSFFCSRNRIHTSYRTLTLLILNSISLYMQSMPK